MPNNNTKLQVKSSGQYLNVLGGGNSNGTSAGQGTPPTTNNFLWEIEAPNSEGYSYIKVQSSGQYLNIFEGGNTNGQRACQGSSNTTDNFLWKIVEAPNHPGWSYFQVKSSGQYLNILGGGNTNGQLACQGIYNSTDNFLWRTVPAQSKAVTINLEIDCPALQTALPQGGPVSDAIANADLEFGDDNNGRKENSNQSSFESIVYPGSSVRWTASTKSGNRSDYSVRIDSIEKDALSGNIFSEDTITPGSSGKLTASVLWTAIPPISGDNETYTVHFSIKPKQGDWIPYSVDPKLRVHT
jgi:hypothetical protein